MSRSHASASIAILAEVRDYQKKMASIPGMTDKAAAKAAGNLEKRLVKAQQAAAKEAKKAAAKSSGFWADAGATMAGAFGAQAVMGAMSSIAGAIEGAASRFADMVGDVEVVRESLVDLSDTTGIATETLDAFRMIATVNGEEFDQFRGGLVKFNETAAKFTTGSGKAKNAFAALGFTSEEVSDRMGDTDGLLRDVIGGLQDVEDTAEKGALAMAFFGSKGADFARIMGDLNLDGFIDRASEFGVRIGPQAADAVREWEAASGALSIAMENVAARVAESVMGSGDLSSGVRELSVRVIGFGASLQAVIEKLPSFNSSMMAAKSAVGTVTEMLIGPLATQGIKVWAGIAGEALGASDAIGDVTEAGTTAEREFREFLAELDATTRTAREEREKQAKSLRDEAESRKNVAAWTRGQAEELKELNKAKKIETDTLNERARLFVARADVERRVRRERAEEERKAAERKAAAHRKDMADAASLAALEIDSAQDVAAARVELGRAAIDTVNAVTDQILRNADTETAAGRAAAKTAFRLQQAARVAQIQADAAVASMAVWRSGNPIAAGIMQGVIALNATVATATVLSQRPPFHRGGYPGEVPATLQRGERVVSRQEVAEVGGPSALESLLSPSASADRRPQVMRLELPDGAVDLIADAVDRRTTRSMPLGW